MVIIRMRCGLPSSLLLAVSQLLLTLICGVNLRLPRSTPFKHNQGLPHHLWIKVQNENGESTMY
jgi:hypothetical protein